MRSKFLGAQQKEVMFYLNRSFLPVVTVRQHELSGFFGTQHINVKVSLMGAYI